jgi:SAM-dependent methyltransferase
VAETIVIGEIVAAMQSPTTQQPNTVAELTLLFRQEQPGVPREISPADGMLEGDRRHYFSVGQSALRGIRLALLAAGKEDCRNVLDYGCGHGRVLRVLRAAFPNARLTACDLVKDAADYCARAFGAAPVYAAKEPERTRLGGGFDLIWCGTLLTNLGLKYWAGLLRLFHRNLAPGGVLVITTHGRLVAERIRRRDNTYGVPDADISGLLGDYDRTGFGYRDYPPETLKAAHIEGDYGISLSSPAWVCSQLEKLAHVRLLTYTERLWDNHQDVVACVRDPE